MVKISTILLSLASIAISQNYNISVPEFNCVVEVNRDQSLDISYEILFECTPGFTPLDIVDIGFPTEDFSLSDVEARMDNHPLSRIYYSTYIDNGVEVHLDEFSIYGGEQGRFRFTGVNRNMVFLDTESDDYASMEFTPTWFDSGILSGSSDFTLTVIFPQGAEPDLVRYHDRPFTESRLDKDGRVVYIWHETRRVDSPYPVGVSFPDDLVDGSLTDRPKAPLISPEALVFIAVFGFIFLFFAFIIFVIVKSVIDAKKRREQYLPPRLGLEGTGIKRGLTAPMAALLLEEKLDRVFLLVIFGLLKKGKVRLDGHKLERTGSDEGLRSYEKQILALIPTGGLEKPIPTEPVRKVFLDMIKELQKKMDGYSLKETREYYRSIIDRAWRMVMEDGSSEKAGEILGNSFQWMLADGKYEQRVRKIPENRTAILPAYMYGYLSGRAVSTPGGMSLGNACSQLAGALESAAGRTVANITSLSRSVTATTNPIPVSTSRSSSGSGCACACACAGCACACAGGGR